MTRELRIAAERNILRGLCCAARGSAVRNKIIRLLRDYSFLEPEHHAVFQAIRTFSPRAAISVRQLTVKLNNLGFPDIELENYFASAGVSDNALLAEARRLLETP